MSKSWQMYINRMFWVTVNLKCQFTNKSTQVRHQEYNSALQMYEIVVNFIVHVSKIIQMKLGHIYSFNSLWLSSKEIMHFFVKAWSFSSKSARWRLQFHSDHPPILLPILFLIPPNCLIVPYSSPSLLPHHNLLTST